VLPSFLNRMCCFIHVEPRVRGVCARAWRAVSATQVDCPDECHVMASTVDGGIAVALGSAAMMTAPTALTAAQCRAGRALIEWSQQQLSQSAAIDVQTIADFEKRFRSADETTRRRLRATLEAAGVVFIAENGGGAGARLKFSRDEVWEVNRWESEGGVTGEDDVL